ncbi:multidrug transporter [Corynebacterium sp. sy017]|nr:multidrug transporter [Corynebacterium sp. sy017]TSD92031.1 multidrug transporter [Corynebacterium sp. SY003]
MMTDSHMISGYLYSGYSDCSDEKMQAHTIRIESGQIIDISEYEPENEQQAASLPLLVPGFIDVHNHGGFHGSFPNGNYEDCKRAARFHRSHGTTTLLASLVSASEQQLYAQTRILARLAQEGEIYGIHMEGPFICAHKCGAQDPHHIIPGNPEILEKVINNAQGFLRSITFAPETDHIDELLDLCAKHNVIASLGHTDADYHSTLAVIDKARQLGVTVSATHLFNAMPPIHHRTPGATVALLNAAQENKVFCELVADGVHLHDAVVDMSYPHNAIAVTDAMEAAGMPDGHYQLGSLSVVVEQGGAFLADAYAQGTHTIAGGTSTLAQQFARFASRHGIADAVRFTSTRAAQLLGLPDRSRLEPGARADIVALNKDHTVRATFAHGEKLLPLT